MPKPALTCRCLKSFNMAPSRCLLKKNIVVCVCFGIIFVQFPLVLSALAFAALGIFSYRTSKTRNRQLGPSYDAV